MRSKIQNIALNAVLVAGALLVSSVSSAADVYLRAEAFTKDIDGTPVQMWGFVRCDDDTFLTCGTVSAPGPQVDLSTADSLNIYLKNTLPIPVSIMIPGQAGGGAPHTVGGRVRSMTAETAAGATGTYTWLSLKAGTYLYQSGTVPSLEVPMGLYGALVVTDGAYPGVAYATDKVLLFSEVDPLQNGRVHNAASGGVAPTPSCMAMADFLAGADGYATAYPCSIDYDPTYYLVNGEPTPDLSGFTKGTSVLVRLVNAGLRTHTPAFVNHDMLIYAEDGNLYPHPLRQSEALLTAGKTLDAILALPDTADLTIRMLDRQPTFSDESLPTGGSRTTFTVGQGSTTGNPANTLQMTISVPEDGSETFAAGASGVTIAGTPSHGTAKVESNGSDITYTPFPDFSGRDAFTFFRPASGSTVPTTVYVTANVSFENDAPTGKGDAYSNTFEPSISVAAPGVLGNDSDVDGDTLQAWVETPLAGLTFNADGSFDYAGSSASFEYRVCDGAVTNGVCGGLASDPVAVNLTINPNRNLALNVTDSRGTQVTHFRWLVQEDASFHNNAAAPAPLLEQQTLNFHKSYMPVVAQGCYGCLKDVNVDPQEDFPGPGDIDYDGDGVFDGAGMIDFADLHLDPAKHYYVSVLPNDGGTGQGRSIGGASIPAGATGTINVFVNNQEIPTAQVSVYVFADHAPTNGVPDATEEGLGGFQVVLEDAGGRYGMSGGPMSQDAFGNPLTNALATECGAPEAPPGIIVSCPDGRVLIKNLPPAKYGVIVVPPANEQQWIQTSTIEGTAVVDAWVKAGEPQAFIAFGGPGPHVFMGFVDPAATVMPSGGGNAITGKVTLLHDPRPPGAPGLVDSGSYAGLGHTRAWIGLNSIAGDGPSYATVQADEDGRFSIGGVPNGDYQLVVWDTYLDQVIGFQVVTVTDASVDVGNVPVNNWFTRFEHNVFLDKDGNGKWDPGEPPLPEQAINLRWRDGSMNQSFPTDSEGFVPFDEVFPFFAWQVWEVDYTRMRPTGMTAIVDAGGTVDTGGRGANILNSKYIDGSSTERTELGSTVLLQAFQGFPGQTSMIDWGKKPYQPGENGGISGIVSYASTRGEEDPRLTVMDPWEAGIPSVEVRLYSVVQLPACPEDQVDPNDPGKICTTLALIQTVQTDSWDNSPPEGCLGEDPTDKFTTDTLGTDNIDRCYDGWRNWNQVRPGVFDGGYAFNDIPPGEYVVEVVPPPGYEIYKEQDVNVGFGDAFGNPPTGYAGVSVVLPNGTIITNFIPDAAMVAAVTGPQPGLAQPPCVGPEHMVPPELSLFPGEPAPFAYAARPLCTRKKVLLSDQGQSAADFHLFTSTPVAAQFAGLITDDLANEANPAAPGFGEKSSPAYLPFSIRDWSGHEVYRGYSDAFGRYNGVLPSTFTANMPIPSGYSPAMMAACLNDPGDGPTLDPLVNPSYGTFCYTMQFMPATTTYLDTPVLPTAAFAAGFNSPDCAQPAGTPVIASVGVQGGGTGPLVAPGGTLVIRSMGQNADVPNPAYEGPTAPAPYNQPLVQRDLGFGQATGSVTIGGVNIPVSSSNWNANQIRVTVPVGTPSGQLVVTRANGNRSVNAVTVTVGTETPIRVPGDHPTIQAAIDAATPGQLILVAPGVYSELVVMYKPVRLQGSGAETIVNAIKRPVEKLEAWTAKVEGLVNAGTVDLLPGQPVAGVAFGPGLLGKELGAGITVLAKNDGSWNTSESGKARIDGFQITGADGGGGIFVNGYAHNLDISNNLVTGNSGDLHGGVRVGHYYLPQTGNGPFGFNRGINIHHNAVTRNGAIGEQSAGGGIALATGTDNYTVASNFVCGNFSGGDGAGIAHLGLSNNGRIENNTVLYNQSYNATIHQSGGGVFIAGEPDAIVVPNEPIQVFTRGAGNVTVNANRIQGNAAGAGHGGGLRAQLFNGVDAQTNGSLWRLEVTNNIIVNNVAAWSGGGISLLDVANGRIVNNTVANNDSTATVGALIGAGGTSEPQPAGIAAQLHSPILAAATGQTHSNPELVNNIVWHNRAFSFNGTGLSPAISPTTVGGCDGGTADYRDLGVAGSATLQLSPAHSVLSEGSTYLGSNGNVTGDPAFLSGYCNGARTLSTPGPMLATAAFNEGGNFVDVRYGPLTQAWPAGSARWDYHIAYTSAAFDSGDNANRAAFDFDGEARPVGIVEIGADEVGPGSASFASATGATLTGGTLAFGNRNGTVQASVTLLVGGGSPVTFLDASVTNSVGTAFSVVGGTCVGTSVDPGSNCTVTVQFVGPSGNNARQGTLTVTHTGSNTPLALTLTGS